MIDAEQFNRIEDMAVESIQDLRANIIKLLVKRIMAVDYSTLIESNRLLAYKLQSAGLLMDDIVTEVAHQTEKTTAAVRKIFEDSYVQSINYDNSVYERYGIDPLPYNVSEGMLGVLNNAMEQTNGELRNMTRTLANSSQSLYMGLLDEAYMKVRSGSFSYEQAIADTVTDAIDQGAYIRYPSGKSERIEVVTRRAVLCGVNQSSIRAAVERCRDNGWNHIIVSSHLGARTAKKGKPDYANHSAWQGKVYWLDAPDGDHESFVATCGWGHGDGIGGWGCRHSAFAWRPGMGNPYQEYDSEENRKQYELVSKQRAKERKIRDTKMRLTGLRAAIDQADDPAVKRQLQDRYDKAAAKLREYNKDYKDFCKANDLKPYNERLKIAEWSAKESKQAVLAANRYAKVPSESEKYIDFGCIKRVTFKKEVDHTIISSKHIGIIKNTIAEIGEEYHVKLDNFEIKNMDPQKYRGVPIFFRANDVDGKYESSLVVNNSCKLWRSSTFRESVFNSGYFAGKSIEDFVRHEVGHVITFQPCRTKQDYLTMEAQVRERYIDGISQYNMDSNDGAESIAESFVRSFQGQKLSMEEEMLLDDYIERWRK